MDKLDLSFILFMIINYVICNIECPTLGGLESSKKSRIVILTRFYYVLLRFYEISSEFMDLKIIKKNSPEEFS
jgi:hypothetical protein